MESNTSDALMKHVYVYSTILICLCYSYFISLLTRNGIFRLVFLLPAICLLPVLPLYLPHIIFSVFPTTYFTFISTGRLVLFAFGKGPLSSAQSLYSFTVYAALSLRSPSSRFPFKPTKMSIVGLKISFIAILTGATEQYKNDFRPNIVLLSYACIACLSEDCFWDVVKYFWPNFMGLELEPLSHEPYLSRSLQEFWGRRWNLTVSDILRDMVYIPVKSVSAPAPACLAAFLASGLVHELMLYYATRAPPSWVMTSFFVVHGIVVVLEVRMKKALKGGPGFQPFVSMALTNAFLILTAFWLYFLPLIKTGVFDMVFKDLLSLGGFAHNGMALLV